MIELTFIEKIIDIQQRYKADKTENNSFGGYQYRNIEKMLISLKPFLKEHKLLIGFDDALEFHGDRYYIKSRVTLTDGKELIEAYALAREEFEKKKSDASQLTGSASTYARKYALCGLLGVDDGQNDPDSKDNDRGHYVVPVKSKQPYQNPQALATDKQKQLIVKILKEQGVALEEQSGYMVEQYGVEMPLTAEGASFVIEQLIN